MIRIGQSTDVHRLESGYRLMIGGVHVPSAIGSVGHSDGDCLLHTVCEALIGALSLGDLGKLFPDTSEEFSGIDSSLLVKKVMKRVNDLGYRVVNIDSMILLEHPKLRNHIDQMRINIAKLLEISLDNVSVKATTTEGLGFVGKNEGIMTQSVVLIEKDD